MQVFSKINVVVCDLISVNILTRFVQTKASIEI